MKEKKRTFFVTFSLFQRNLFNICVLSQFLNKLSNFEISVYEINFQNIYTLIPLKSASLALLHVVTFLLVFVFFISSDYLVIPFHLSKVVQ